MAVGPDATHGRRDALIESLTLFSVRAGTERQRRPSSVRVCRPPASATPAATAASDTSCPAPHRGRPGSIKRRPCVVSARRRPSRIQRRTVPGLLPARCAACPESPANRADQNTAASAGFIPRSQFPCGIRPQRSLLVARLRSERSQVRILPGALLDRLCLRGLGAQVGFSSEASGFSSRAAVRRFLPIPALDERTEPAAAVYPPSAERRLS